MNNIIGYDSPLMMKLGKVADLFLLNLITLVCCIPIITIGASLTACYYTALKLKRGEGYMFRNFWTSFKENLLKSTVLFLILIILGGLMLFLHEFLASNEIGTFKSFFKRFLFCDVVGMYSSIGLGVSDAIQI